MAFEARYQSVCGGCGKRIHAGDWAKYVEDSLVHADCEDASWPGRKPEVVCTTCWLVRPCGCEDPS